VKVNADLLNEVVQALRSHPLSAALDLRVGSLRSRHVRKVFYKQAFSYVEPVEMTLEDGSHYHYVPIKSTLRAIYSDENVDLHLQNFQTSSDCSDSHTMLHDFSDGTVCKQD
jgi:hypothetical protein